MNRPLDPDAPDSIALSLRITRPLAAALDEELARFTAQNPGVSASRALVARIALMRVFLPSGTVLASASAPAPVVAAVPSVPVVVAPAQPAVGAGAREHGPRPPRVVPAPVEPPTVDPRQGQLAILATAASDAPRSESADAHERLRDRFADVRDLFHITFADAERALAAARLPVKNLHREMVTPSAKWTPAHAAALVEYLDTGDANDWPAAGERAAASNAPVSEPSADATPRRARAVAVATPENDALRARYCAAIAAKQLTNEPTAKLVGCSEGALRQWKSGAVKNLGADGHPEWLANLTSILEGVEPLT